MRRIQVLLRKVWQGLQTHRRGCCWGAALAIVALAAAVRLPRLDAFITPDEMKWVCRSVNFHRALASGHFAQTRQTGHPGVITMWLGAPFGEIDPATPWLDQCLRPNISDIIQENDPELPVELASYLFKARRGVALWTSLFMGISIWLLARLLGWRVALTAGLLLALEPFPLAHARLLHLDAIVTSLLFPSTLALIEGLRTNRRRFLVLSGALLGLAMLNKSPAMFGLGFAGLLTLWWGLRGHRSLNWLIKCGLSWAFPALAIYCLLWPAMWVEPLQTLELVFGTAFFYASRPHDNSNFFWGAPRPDPGLPFYPVALAFRLTPWALLLAAAGLIWLRYRPARRQTLGAIALFVILYGLFMTVGQKKFDRYLLPVFPFVLSLAAWGLYETVRGAAHWLRLKRPDFAATEVALLLALGLGLSTQSEAPYYLTYYNPLLGGRQAAVEKLLVGWGEGLDQAGAYLSGIANASDIAVSRSLPGFAPFYGGRALHQSAYDPATTRYVVLYLNEIQRRLEPELMQRYYDVADPLQVIRVKGIDYVWIYENRTHQPPLAYMMQHAEAGDALVVMGPSILQESYAAPYPLHVIDPSLPRQDILEQLQQVTAQSTRVWTLEYLKKNPDPLLDWLHFQLSTHLRRLDRVEFTDVRLTLWDVGDIVSFVGATEIRRPLEVRFEDLALRGYTLHLPATRWEHAVGVTLEWEVLDQPLRYYACSIHVLDAEGRRVGQGDKWLQNAILQPTVDWRTGDIVHEEIALELVTGLAPGSYQLVISVYDRVTDEPVWATMPAGESAVFAEMGTVQVAPSRAKWSLHEGRIEQPLDRLLMPDLLLRGYTLSNTQPLFGETLTLTLAWQAISSPRSDYRLRFGVVAPDGELYAEAEFPVLSEGHPTSAWEAGESYWRHYALDIAEEARYGPATVMVTLLDAEGRALSEPVELAQLEVQGHRFVQPDIPSRQQAMIGEEIALLGYHIEGVAHPGGQLALTLYWQAVREAPASYTVFVHLLDESGTMRGQKDSVPLEGRYPTDRWRIGEYVIDAYEFAVDGDAPPGEYHIEIGMYDPSQEGASRIALYGADGARQQDDRLLLDATLSIAP